MPDDDADDAALDAEIEAALTAADADADGVPKLGWRAWARSKLGRAADTSQLPETVAGPPPLVIADLLAQHAEKVAAVRAAMPSATAHYDPTQHDDLWCLRFLLSHKLAPPKAVAAMAAALELRHTMGLDEVAVHVRTLPCERWPAWAAFEECLPLFAVYTHWPHPDGGLIHLCRAPEVDLRALAAKIDKLEFFLKYALEWNFQILDDASRRCGRILKITRVFDCPGFSPRRQLSLAAVRKLTALSAQWESLYPQLLGVQLFCHVPKVLRGLLDHVIVPLFPARLTEKTRVIAPRERADDRAALLAWIGEGDVGAAWLPKYLGGTAELEASHDWVHGHRGGRRPNQSLTEWLADNGRPMARPL